MSNFTVILGAKDGIGATTLAVNLAFAVQKKSGGKVLLINLSHPGDIAFALGQNGNMRTFADIKTMLDRWNPSMAEGMFRVHQKGIGLVENVQDINLAPEIYSKFFDAIETIYPNIIIDAGSSVSPAVAEALKKSRLRFLVISADALVLAETERKLKKFARAFLPKESFSLAAMKWEDTPYLPRSCVKEKVGLECDYWLGSFAQVGASLNCGSPFILENQKHPFTQGIEDIAKEILSETSAPSLSQVNWSELIPAEKEQIKDHVKKSEQVNAGNNTRVSNQATPLTRETDRLKQDILEKLLDAIDLKDVRSVSKDASGKKELYSKTESVVLQILAQMDANMFSKVDRKQLVREVLDEALGLGPLEQLLADNNVSEVMVNASNQIYAERTGKLSLTPFRFTSDRQLMRVVERIVAPIGRRIDESSPMVDARLADGSRVNIVIPPLALRGPAITIRKFAATPLQISDLVRYGSLTDAMAKFLKGCVEGRLNVLVSGGTGSGKTTLLNVLSSFIPNDERIVTIEDAAELQLNQEHVVRLESRPANIEGRGAVTIRDLVKNALRMRPDRIIVGECRGGEALDMLQAMNTGHDGSLTTVHANNPRDSIARLETLVMFAGVDLPSRAIREQIVAAIDLVVQLTRLSDGSRRIVQITEISGMEGDTITMQDAFVFKQTGIGADGKINGEYVASGFRPKFAEALKAKGIEL